jgi:hypothetical protein
VAVVAAAGTAAPLQSGRVSEVPVAGPVAAVAVAARHGMSALPPERLAVTAATAQSYWCGNKEERMPLTASEIQDIDMGSWAPGTRFFSGSDGKHFVIDTDTTEYPTGPTRFIRRDTAVLYCNADASVTDLTPDHVYPPGTTAEEAISDMGYTLQ